MIGHALLVLGAALTLLAAIGMVRFRDAFSRMHALTKASTAGSLLVLLGAAIAMSHPNDVTSLVLAAALQVLTSPVAANMVSRATYRTERDRPGTSGPRPRSSPSTRRSARS